MTARTDQRRWKPEMNELFELDAIALSQEIKEGTVSPHGLMEATIARAERIDQSIHSLVNMQKDNAFDLIAKTDPKAPLYGVPTLLKDLGAEAIDFPSHNGSKLFKYTKYDYDSSIYTRIRSSGMIPFARTASPELGIGPTSEAGVYENPSRNPWNIAVTSGGSSGGSAAAVAAGIVTVAHGSDGGGSVRIPASCCGLVGFKPTRARLPDGPAAGEGWAGMATDGFLTRSLRDTAFMLDHCSGEDLGAPYFAPPLKKGFVNSLELQPTPLRIAVMYTDFMGNAIHHECKTAVKNTANILSHLGHNIVVWEPEISESVSEMMLSWNKIVAAGTLLSIRRKKPVDDLTIEDVDGVTYGAVQLGLNISGADYLEAINTIHGFGRRMAKVLQDYDVILSPTLAEPPAAIGRFKPTNSNFIDYRSGRDGVFSYSPYTAVYNASGQPAVSLPLHWSSEGLPIGVHLATAFGEDELLISLSRQLEISSPWSNKQVSLVRQFHQN